MGIENGRWCPCRNARDRKDTHGQRVYEAEDGKHTNVRQQVDEDGEKDRLSSINDEQKLSQPTTSTS